VNKDALEYNKYARLVALRIRFHDLNFKIRFNGCITIDPDHLNKEREGKQDALRVGDGERESETLLAFSSHKCAIFVS
jgi:hypothetical protein